jgi:ABC-2 type transport system permease protein
MFWVIARYQLRLLAREHVAWVAVGLLCAGMAYSFGSGSWQLRREREAQFAFLQRSHEVVVRNQELAAGIEKRIAAGAEVERVPPPFGTRHPAYAGTWSRQPALLPPSPLEWLAFGQSDLYPTAYAGPEYDEVNQIGNPLTLSVGHWDLTTAIVYLLPLVILALGFDLTASERERGVWRLTLSQPVRGSTVLLAKWIAVSAVVLATVGVIFLSGIVVVGRALDHGMILRASVAAVAILAYAGFWLGFVLGVNVLKRSAAQNAMICAAAWLLFVVFLPFAIDQVATHFYPVTPHSALADISRSAPEQANRTPRPELVSKFLARHPEIRVPANLSDLGQLYLERAARQEAIQGIRQAAQDKWEEQLRSQQALAHRLACVSPPALLTTILVELAGTGRSRYLDFMRQKRQFEQKYDAVFLPRRLALPNSIFRAADYSLIPTMRYQEEPIENVFRRVLPHLLGLILLSGITCGLATIRR